MTICVQMPTRWIRCRFSRVIGAIKDGTHGTFARVPVGKPLLSAKNVQGGYLEIGGDESLISEDDHADIVSNGFPRKGDLLLTIVGTIGRACVYEKDQPIAFQRSVCFIRLLPGFAPKFFYFLSQSQYFQDQLAGRSKSSAQAGVYMGDVLATEVYFPQDQVEQLAIANFLDRETGKIDALIGEQKKLISLLAEKRQATISHAVTHGINPDSPMRDSGVAWVGKVPAHWEMTRVKRFTRTIEQGWSPQCENFPVEASDEWGVLKVGCVNGGCSAHPRTRNCHRNWSRYQRTL